MSLRRSRQPRSKIPEARPYAGKMKKVMSRLARGDKTGALAEALRWWAEKPGDVMALVAMGEALQALGRVRLAARVYGSIIDLFPSRADMRRFAGQRLEALGKVGLALAVDTYARAVSQRPDHPSSHRLYGYALLQQDQVAAAFAAAEKGLTRRYPRGRFKGVGKVLVDDLRLIGAVWIRRAPKRESEIRARLKKRGLTPADQATTRFVLTWETDANDVDLHINDGEGDHAYYSKKSLPSGGSLYADVTTGYGPESFTIRGPAKAFPYRLRAHYYRRGPMGYGMGKLTVIQHDGKGGVKISHRPFVVMNDRAYVDLGVLKRPL